jgi:ribosomal protein L37E
MKEKEICNDCGAITYIYHKKKKQCQYCWKKERSASWIANSKAKKPTKIKPRSKKAIKQHKMIQNFFISSGNQSHIFVKIVVKI